MSPSALAKKMHLKPGHRVLVKSAPDGFIENHLSPLPDGAEISTTARGQFDAAQFFVKGHRRNRPKNSHKGTKTQRFPFRSLCLRSFV
ncbi:MAG: hypothetical protein O2820_02605 [Planctomycetota bacterium]|nr:hypothetical protein [Planctomycetota bacterium]MDA1248092.1 hypothetical protein [Planctomycetota bacterium]